nr:hypothetical protein [Bacillus sp. SD088]
MVWFPAAETINQQMQAVLDYDVSNTVFSNFYDCFNDGFWKHSLKFGLIILNVTLIGKVTVIAIHRREWLGTSRKHYF